LIILRRQIRTRDTKSGGTRPFAGYFVSSLVAESGPPDVRTFSGKAGVRGFKIPCLVRGDGEVIDGHLRLKAARKLGITDIPVIVCDEWTPMQVKAFRLMVNRRKFITFPFSFLPVEIRIGTGQAAVKPLLSAFTLAAHSRQDALSGNDSTGRSPQYVDPNRSGTHLETFRS
jgi:hypothetical protein